MSLPGRQPPPLGKVQAQDPVVTKAFDDLRAKLADLQKQLDAAKEAPQP